MILSQIHFEERERSKSLLYFRRITIFFRTEKNLLFLIIGPMMMAQSVFETYKSNERATMCRLVHRVDVQAPSIIMTLKQRSF